MIRHEIIAPHLAVTKGKVKFSPSCSQIKVRVGGNQRGASNANELVTFPGATAIVTWVSMILTYITHWNLLLMFAPVLRLLALWEVLAVQMVIRVMVQRRPLLVPLPVLVQHHPSSLRNRLASHVNVLCRDCSLSGESDIDLQYYLSISNLSSNDLFDFFSCTGIYTHLYYYAPLQRDHASQKKPR